MSQVPKAILVYESPKSSQLECLQWGIRSVPRQREIWPSQVGRTYMSLLAAVGHDQKALLQQYIFYFLFLVRQVLLNSTSTSTTRGGFLLSTPMPSLPVHFAFYSHYGEFLDSSISYPRTTASKFIL